MLGGVTTPPAVALAVEASAARPAGCVCLPACAVRPILCLDMVTPIPKLPYGLPLP